MSLEGSGLAALIAKVGWVKVATLGSALAGAFLMAIFRPPKSRKEMLLQAIVALGCSYMFGDSAYTIINKWIPLDYVAVHGLVGALSWGAFGGLAHTRDKLSNDPIQVAKDVKDLL